VTHEDDLASYTPPGLWPREGCTSRPYANSRALSRSGEQPSGPADPRGFTDVYGARCGFAAYSTTGTWEDQWVAEYWRDAQHRCVLVDARIDARRREMLDIRFGLSAVGDSAAPRASSGAHNWCRPANANPASASTPTASSTWNPAAAPVSRACCSRADLPMPASLVPARSRRLIAAVVTVRAPHRRVSRSIHAL
jgi:hypothetical protein